MPFRHLYSLPVSNCCLQTIVYGIITLCLLDTFTLYHSVPFRHFLLFTTLCLLDTLYHSLPTLYHNNCYKLFYLIITLCLLDTFTLYHSVPFRHSLPLFTTLYHSLPFRRCRNLPKNFSKLPRSIQKILNSGSV